MPTASPLYTFQLLGGPRKAMLPLSILHGPLHDPRDCRPRQVCPWRGHGCDNGFSGSRDVQKRHVAKWSIISAQPVTHRYIRDSSTDTRLFLLQCHDEELRRKPLFTASIVYISEQYPRVAVLAPAAKAIAACRLSVIAPTSSKRSSVFKRISPDQLPVGQKPCLNKA